MSISDIHGYLDAARSALLTLTDHPDFEPIIEVDEGSVLYWADENYVLVFNGDLIDRGPANENVLAMVARLTAEAPPSRVRVTLGNHEAIILSPRYFGFTNWFSGQIEADDRRTFLHQILAGHVVGAYHGYNVAYAHAGASDPYDVPAINEALLAAAKQLLRAAGTRDDEAMQRQVINEYSCVLGVGEEYLKGRGAGLVWLDFSELAADAPPQVVGHTRHQTPTQKGNVFCQNVVRANLGRDGGEAVFVETPRTLTSLVRQADGEAATTELAQFDR